ncbi:MAG: hypothetical protein ABF649_00780 [Bacillus sp. (in: firmicutes)]
MATWGILKKNTSIPSNRNGYGQGYFRFYKEDSSYEAIIAVNGRLIREGGDLPIEGLPDGFQTERMIEAVQWNGILYIATGTKLVEYNGVTAKVVDPYKVLPLEALYVGTNALADDPENYMQDGQETYLRVDGAVPSLQKGVANTKTTFTAFVSKPEGVTIEYKWQYRLSNSDTFLLGKNWSTDKTWDFTPKNVGNYTIQVSARVQGTAEEPNVDAPEVYQIPIYTVTSYDENEKADTSQIHTCNRILLHWSRLIVYGDTKNARNIYISHLNNSRYFPTNHTLEFESGEQEALQKIVRYRDYLVAFLPTSIQALYGQSPEDFKRVVVHTGLGCVAPETPKVMGNYIAFLSKQGVQILKSAGLTEEKINVEKIDSNIDNLIPVDSTACAVVYNNQYHICFPKNKTRFRFYYELGVWTKDESPHMDFSRLFEWDGDLVGQSTETGNIVMFIGSVFNDLGFVYEDRVITKSFDFNEHHNHKKYKELQLMLGRGNSDVDLSVLVNVDDNPVFNTIEGKSEIVEGTVRWKEVLLTNISLDAGTVFGAWELGVSAFDNTKQSKVSIPLSAKGYVTSIDIRHTGDGPNVILSLGIIFKIKKP